MLDFSRKLEAFAARPCSLLRTVQRPPPKPSTRSHLVNLGKYATSFTAVIIGAAHPDFTSHSSSWPMQRVLYILLLVASTLYSFAWDILMDFSYFQRSPDGHWEPRKLLVAASRKYLISLDLIGRCAWGYTIVVRPPGDRYRPEGSGAGAYASLLSGGCWAQTCH